MQPIKARLIKHIGTRFYLRVFTYSNISLCSARDSGCDAQIHLKTTDELFDNSGSVDDHERSKFPKVCSYCGNPFPENAEYQLHRKRHYNTASGDPEIGDLYYADYWGSDFKYFDNQEGPMLIAKCPGGLEWNIDSRASNCGLPEDRLHRCWVRHGEPPEIHVDKNGLTCNAGAGSIATANWHGFLHHGYFHE